MARPIEPGTAFIDDDDTLGDFEIVCKTLNGMRVACKFGEGAPSVTEGYGGWVEVQRPRRTSLVNWQGKAPLKLSLALVFDRYAENRSVEGNCRKLERMAMPLEIGVPPPTIQVDGPIPHRDSSWVIADIAWGDALRNRDGVRLRQWAVLDLWEYVPPDKLSSLGSALRPRTRVSTPRGPYKVKAGDTLKSIAREQLGDESAYKRIAKLNKIRDLKAKLKPGRTLKLP